MCVLAALVNPGGIPFTGSHLKNRSVVRAFTMFATLVSLLMFGCGGPSDQPQLVDVTGHVTLDGEPLAGALVLFGPEEGRSSFAYTDEEGHFELMYLADTAGAVTGLHKVSITAAPEEEEEPDPGSEPVVEPVPAKYNTATTLTRVVEAGEDNDFTFELTTDE